MPSVGSTPTTTSPAPQPPNQQPSSSSFSSSSSSSATSTTVAAAAAAITAHQQQQHQHAKHPKSQSQSSAHSSSGSSGNHHRKLKQQNSLPLQLQYQHHQPQVTTTQPSPAGTFMSQSGAIMSTAGGGRTRHLSHLNDDLSPPSSPTNSFSSVDTNQTLLNNIAASRLGQSGGGGGNQRQQRSAASTATANQNRSYRTKYGNFMIITPAVSIDRDFEQQTNIMGNANNAVNDDDDDDDDPYFGNGNQFRLARMNNSNNSLDSGNTSGSDSASSSFRSNYNPYLHNSRQRLLPKHNAPPQRHTFYTFSSWRWCTLICAAMRCFGGGHSSSAGTYSSSFARPPYQRSRSSGANNSKTPHRRLRPSSSFTAETAFEHFSAPFTPRKTRDHMNNIMYEL